MRNIDSETVSDFGEEWAAFDQTDMSEEEHHERFQEYFSIFPWEALPPGAEGFDLGCGSGRWAVLVAPRVGRLHCIDPAQKALDVAKRRLAGQGNAEFHVADADVIPLADGSQDFGYSLGVLHHIPDTLAAMQACTRKLKPGAPFLVYLYYAFDQRPFWFRGVWRASDAARRIICRLPFGLKKLTTTAIAGAVYWPMTRLALALERGGRNVDNFPLSYYRRQGFYTMRTDALDRFGTRLEHRFTRAQIERMMRASDLDDVTFSDQAPYWVACGRKKASSVP